MLGGKTIFSNCTDLVIHYPAQQALHVISGQVSLVTTGPQPLHPIMEPFWTLNTAQMESSSLFFKIKQTLCHVPKMLYN